jgi:DNA processing protein
MKMNIQLNSTYNSPEDRINILALSLIRGFGPRRFIKIINKYKNIRNVLNLNLDALKQILPCDLAQIVRSKKFLSGIENYIKKLERLKITFITVLDGNYPELLKEIYDPPIVLYIKGDFRKEDLLNCFSVVGTRNCTPYGIEATSLFVRELIQKGFVIVSGMAFGIDSIAHKQAIRSEGRTIAVLSSSVDKPSPLSNVHIYNRILDNGFLISECPLEYQISAGMFPLRNRIIAGISKGVLVTEAPEKSGALITARLALEQGREVFAVPSNIYNIKGIGTNCLIKKGEAKLVQEGKDIFDEFYIKGIRKEVDRKLAKEQLEIFEILKLGPNSIDNIAKSLGKDITQISQIVSFLEIEGIVTKVEGNMYVVLK